MQALPMQMQAPPMQMQTPPMQMLVPPMQMQVPPMQMQIPPMQMQVSPLIPMQTPIPNISAPMHTLMLPPPPMPYMFNFGPQQQQQQQAYWPPMIPQGPVFMTPQKTPMQQISGFRYSPSSPTVLPVQTSRGTVHYYDYNPVYQPASTWQNQQAMVSNGRIIGYNGQPGDEVAQNGSYGTDIPHENNYYSPIYRY